MLSYLVWFLLYLLISVRSSDVEYKVTIASALYIIIKSSLSIFHLQSILMTVFFVDLFILVLLFVIVRDLSVSLLLLVSCIPKSIDICNYFLIGIDLPYWVLSIGLNADEWFICGVILTLLYKEHTNTLTKFYLDPAVVGYKVYILNTVFAILILLNLFY